MSRERDIWVIPLICGGCGARLSADPAGVIFPCPECDAAWEPEGEALARREVTVLSGTGNLYVPFWIFPFELSARDISVKTLAHYRGITGNIAPLEEERHGAPPLAFVPACTGMSSHLLVRAGRLVTLRSPALLRTRARASKLLTIGFREQDASCLAETVVLATIGEERRKSLSLLQTFGLKVGKGRLCAIPFEDQGGRLLHAAWSVEI